jgi:hypothetical protein
MNKNTLWWVIIVLALAVAVGVFLFWLYQRPDPAVLETESTPAEESELLGGDRDEHGCIGSAGYVWCESKQKCLRPWEEACEEDEPAAAADVIPTDDRILLTTSNTSEYCDPAVNLDACAAEDFNTEAATITANYSNKDKGISVDLPYNPNWGSANYKIEPYEVAGDYVYFGPMSQFEGGGWARPYWVLGFVPAQSADDLINQIMTSSETLAGGQPEKIVINGLEVVKYEEMGLGTHYMMEVIGDKSNYRFVASSFGDDPAAAWRNLENIVKTVKLI